ERGSGAFAAAIVAAAFASQRPAATARPSAQAAPAAREDGRVGRRGRRRRFMGGARRRGGALRFVRGGGALARGAGVNKGAGGASAAAERAVARLGAVRAVVGGRGRGSVGFGLVGGVLQVLAPLLDLFFDVGEGGARALDADDSGE